MTRCLFLLLFLFSSLYAKPTCVVVHGFMRSSSSMESICKWLRKSGYEVINFGYPSRSKTIKAHGIALAKKLKQLDPNQPIYFLTHSMGALVVEAAFQDPEIRKLAHCKAIFLAPPHQGSSFGRQVRKYKFTRLIMGKKAGHELLTLLPGEWEKRCPLPSSLAVLVISGRQDGKVAIGECCLQTEHLHLIIDSAHTFIMNKKEVKEVVNCFFNTP